MVDSAGVRIVTSPVPEWGEEEGWRVSPEPSVSIGVREGSHEYELHGVTAVGRLSDGRIVVLNHGSREVRYYSPEGEFLMSRGSEGQGPGEFTSLTGLRILPGDTLAVWDRFEYRTTFFGPDETLIRTEVMDRSALPLTTMPPFIVPPPVPLPDGDYLLRQLRTSGPDAEPTDAPIRHPRILVRGSADLTRWDTLLVYAGLEHMVVEIPGPLPGLVTLPHRRGDGEGAGFGGVPTRVCAGEQEEPEISCFDAEGRETRIRWRPPRVPITPEDIAAWEEEMAQFPFDPPTLERVLSTTPLPEYRPPYAELYVDVLGNLWAQRPGTWLASDEPLDYSVFDPEGAWLGEVTLPPLEPKEIGEDYILGVRRDQFGVEYVEMYRLER